MAMLSQKIQKLNEDSHGELPEFMVDDPNTLSEGYIVAYNVQVTPGDVAPGDTIHIKAMFRNESFLPAYGTLQLKLDGMIIKEHCLLGVCVDLFGGHETAVPWDEDYTLPLSIPAGVTHKIEALEEGQITPAFTLFTVTSPPAPGQRNVNFASVPAGAQIYVSDAYYGDTPLTIPLAPGTYAVKAVYGNQELSRNINVVTGSGSMPISFTFQQGTPFDLGQWLSDNKWTIAGGLVAAGLLYMVIKKPETVKKGISVAKDYAQKGYQKLKEKEVI